MFYCYAHNWSSPYMMCPECYTYHTSTRLDTAVITYKTSDQLKIDELKNELGETHARVHELNERIAKLEADCVKFETFWQDEARSRKQTEEKMFKRHPEWPYHYDIDEMFEHLEQELEDAKADSKRFRDLLDEKMRGENHESI